MPAGCSAPLASVGCAEVTVRGIYIYDNGDGDGDSHGDGRMSIAAALAFRANRRSKLYSVTAFSASVHLGFECRSRAERCPCMCSRMYIAAA